MAGAAPLEVCVERQPAWRAGVLVLAAISCATLLAWWWTQPAPMPAWASATALAGCAGAAACGAGLLRQPRARLRWDGRQWSLEAGTAAAQAGDLGVALDLGSWMLLRFVPNAPAGALPWRRRVRWIAVQRRGGLEMRWHALRCTVYAPRPPASTDLR